MTLPDWVSGESKLKRGGARTAYFIFTLEVILWECSVPWIFVLTVIDYITSSYVSIEFICPALIQYMPDMPDVAMLSIRV